jgi:hypothetical protein
MPEELQATAGEDYFFLEGDVSRLLRCWGARGKQRDGQRSYTILLRMKARFGVHWYEYAVLPSLSAGDKEKSKWEV